MNTDDQGREIPNSVLCTRDTCPKCGSTEMELRNYSMLWHDGDVHCAVCGAYVRGWDAG
ncbi:MAG: hypothetical protein ACE141_18820 [Bryobacteraceae bacterium]